MNFFVARNFRNHWRKYKNPSASRSKIIFNELFLNFDEELVIVEGVFDAIVAGFNAVPLLGSTLSEESKLFHEIVKNDTRVYLALDADAEKKSMRIIGKLLQYGVEVAKINTHGHADVGEMNKEEFQKRKTEAPLINSENFLFYEAMFV
jgi:DNA primase